MLDALGEGQALVRNTPTTALTLQVRQIGQYRGAGFQVVPSHGDIERQLQLLQSAGLAALAIADHGPVLERDCGLQRIDLSSGPQPLRSDGLAGSQIKGSASDEISGQRLIIGAVQLGTNRQLLKPAGDQRLSHAAMKCGEVVACQSLEPAQSQAFGQLPSFGQLIASSHFPLTVGEEDPVGDARHRSCVCRDRSAKKRRRMVGLQVISKLLGALQ